MSARRLMPSRVLNTARIEEYCRSPCPRLITVNQFGVGRSSLSMTRVGLETFADTSLRPNCS